MPKPKSLKLAAIKIRKEHSSLNEPFLVYFYLFFLVERSQAGRLANCLVRPLRYVKLNDGKKFLILFLNWEEHIKKLNHKYQGPDSFPFADYTVAPMS